MRILSISGKTSLLLIFFYFLLIPEKYFAQLNSPLVSKVRFAQRLDKSFKVDIHYDVTETNNLPMIFTVEASNDTRKTWALQITKVTGDVGPKIIRGTNKHFVWDFSTAHTIYFSVKIRIQITADNGISDPFAIA